jgi:hypothetical protein
MAAASARVYLLKVEVQADGALKKYDRFGLISIKKAKHITALSNKQVAI